MGRNKLAACIAAGLAAFTLACGQSDPGITTAVKAKFAADDLVKAYKIDVETREKVVTLTGAVDSAQAKERAVQLARGTDGVTSVVDHLTVSASAAANDDALQRRAAEATADAREGSRAAAEKADEKADRAKDKADSAAERAGRATDRAGDKAGAVSDRARDRAGDTADRAGDKVGETANRAGEAIGDAAITTAVKSKLLADPDVSGMKIDVDTNNGVVTLRGTVPTASERSRALQLAKGTAGVKSVRDQIKVSR